MSDINPLAFVHPNAKIGKNTVISPFAYIAGDVEIGENCYIGPHVCIHEGARIGNNNKLYDGCIISARPQDFRWKGEDTKVIIGDNNTIREYVIINRSIHKDKATIIGNDSFIMAQSHIAHDSEIGNFVVIGNSVKIAGYCKIGDFSIMSSSSMVHEHCEIGKWVLIKGGCRVNGHVPPYTIMAHNPIKYFGVNAYIMKFGNFSEELIDDIAKCYRHIYQSNTSPFNALIRVRQDIPDGPERQAVLDFVEGHDHRIAALNVESKI